MACTGRDKHHLPSTLVAATRATSVASTPAIGTSIVWTSCTCKCVSSEGHYCQGSSMTFAAFRHL